MGTVVGATCDCGLRSSLLDSHVERVDNEEGVVALIDKTADNPSQLHIEEAIRADYFLSRRMLNDLGHLGLVDLRSLVSALGRIVGR
jgi:hypothetical protein